MSRNLSDSQQELVQQFQEIVNLQDETRSIELLSRHNWDLQRAVEGYISQGSSQRGNSARTNTNPQTQTQPAVREAGTTGSGLFDLLFYPMRWLFQTLPLSLNPDQDTTRFLAEFQQQYPSVSLPFYQSSYANAVQQTHSQSRFLLVYLHSPMHDDSDSYVRSVLASSTLAAFINQHHINIWAGRVWDPEAYSLSLQLQASAYPFLALLLPQSNRMVQIVEKVAGSMSDSEVLRVLTRGVEGFREVLQRNRLEHERRSEATRLRAEQDREYQEMLRADAERIAQQQQAERLEAEERQRQAAYAQQMEALREEFGWSEGGYVGNGSTTITSTPGGSGKAGGEVVGGPADGALLRFTLPRNLKVSYKFAKSDTIQHVYDFLKVFFYYSDGNKVKNFRVSTNYPKVELTDMHKTVEEMGLYPRSMLFVQDLDA